MLAPTSPFSPAQPLPRPGGVGVFDTAKLLITFDGYRWTWPSNALPADPVYKCPAVCDHLYGKCPEPTPVYECPHVCEHNFGNFGPCPRPRRVHPLSKRLLALERLIASLPPATWALAS
jgi:hypothetical protein